MCPPRGQQWRDPWEIADPQSRQSEGAGDDREINVVEKQNYRITYSEKGAKSLTYWNYTDLLLIKRQSSIIFILIVLSMFSLLNSIPFIH